MNQDLKARMARYEQELLQMRTQSKPETPVPTIATVATPPPPALSATASTIDVRVVSAENGEPIVGAVVTIDRRIGSGKEPIAVRFSDQNGNIATLTVAAGQPNTVYDIGVAAFGYFRQDDTGIVADGTPIRREVRLAPLPEL